MVGVAESCGETMQMGGASTPRSPRGIVCVFPVSLSNALGVSATPFFMHVWQDCA